MDTKTEFPIAGFAKDIYEDAVIFLPARPVLISIGEVDLIGRVIHVSRLAPTVDFVILLEDGTQQSVRRDLGATCRFALPENTEDKFRFRRSSNEEALRSNNGR